MGLFKRFADAIEMPNHFDDEGGMPVLDREDILARVDRMEAELVEDMRLVRGAGLTAVCPYLQRTDIQP